MAEQTERSLLSIVEASIAELRHALDDRTVTSVELVAASLDRIGVYDRRGIRLNSIPVLSPHAFADAAASDERRRRGATRGPLDGIPYTVKASYAVAGMPLTSGSPAFETLVARQDSFLVSRLRAAGAVLIGLTNMPPMADGGMQRGLYGRAESPYNGDFLAAAWVSGSSNGSGTSTAASFAAFGLGSETWSSGRAPASNSGLVAYTPSRGILSVRGLWPLCPSLDVAVPHTRSVADLLEVLEVIVADDADPSGDFWRVQPYVELPRPSDVRPGDYRGLADSGALSGVRLGVPRMFLGEDPEQRDPIVPRPSVLELWSSARRDLEALGATIVDVDFPALSNDEEDRPGARNAVSRGILPPTYLEDEVDSLERYSWEDFLRRNGDPQLSGLDQVDGRLVFPVASGELQDRFDDQDRNEKLIARAQEVGPIGLDDIPDLEWTVRGLEEVRRVDFEDWLDSLGLDGLVFPTAVDVAPANADRDVAANDIALRNGVRVATGNVMVRRLGIPTVTVTMGRMSDIGMPVGLTFAAAAYRDSDLLRYASAFEASGARRAAPPRTPALHGLPEREVGDGDAPEVALSASVSEAGEDGLVTVWVSGSVEGGGRLESLTVSVDGRPVEVLREGTSFRAEASVPAPAEPLSAWIGPYGALVVAVARTTDGAAGGAHVIVGGV
jgi:amidase